MFLFVCQTHLETSNTRHKAHIKKCEFILRLLDNDELSPDSRAGQWYQRFPGWLCRAQSGLSCITFTIAFLLLKNKHYRWVVRLGYTDYIVLSCYTFLNVTWLLLLFSVLGSLILWPLINKYQFAFILGIFFL